MYFIFLPQQPKTMNQESEFKAYKCVTFILQSKQQRQADTESEHKTYFSSRKAVKVMSASQRAPG